MQLAGYKTAELTALPADTWPFEGLLKKSDKQIFPGALAALVAVFDGRCSVFTFAAGDKKLAILATSLPAELAPFPSLA